MEERGWQGPDSILGGGRLSYFLVETLSITGQKHLKCSKNGNGRLRKRKREAFRIQSFKGVARTSSQASTCGKLTLFLIISLLIVTKEILKRSNFFA